MDLRRIARGMALQILYELDSSDHPAQEMTTFRDAATTKWDDARARAYLALRAYYDESFATDENDDNLEIAQFDRSQLFSVEEQKLAYHLVSGVSAHRVRLDSLIQRFSPEWPIDQIATIDRNILRISLYEFGISRETPIKVAINEAVELAKAFGSDSAASFINGVLGSLADHYQEIIAENQDKPE